VPQGDDVEDTVRSCERPGGNRSPRRALALVLAVLVVLLTAPDAFAGCCASPPPSAAAAVHIEASSAHVGAADCCSATAAPSAMQPDSGRRAGPPRPLAHEQCASVGALAASNSDDGSEGIRAAPWAHGIPPRLHICVSRT
jgi:hypothetical protein